MKAVSNIIIELKDELKLFIDARKNDTLFDAQESAKENNEARFQLLEGCFYDYELSDKDYSIADIGESIIQQHKRNQHIGTISPNIFVGTLDIPILKNGVEFDKLELEVQSIKSNYRDDYRDMLEFITEQSTELLLQANSPVSQHFEIDYTKNSQTLYQKFSFIKSVIGTEEFSESIHRIVTSPVTKWSETTEIKDIRNAKRFSNANIKELLKGGNRTILPNNHCFREIGLESLPERITTIRKTDSFDTPENRFIKHALETFLKFCTDINQRAISLGHKNLRAESENLIKEVETHLQHSIFKKILNPTTLKLNSPILQRKEGYREVLRVWLMFDLAAKLIWKGGDDVYSGGKKDIATLYEYWLFFKLLDLFKNIFKIEPKDISNLIQETENGLNLQIKQGKFTALGGVYDEGYRKLNVRFNYNRSFGGRKSYPNSGSWTTTMRPDYTLSFWTYGLTENEAEEQELIVHIHFDAKYKISNLNELLEQNVTTKLDTEKNENRKGIYKNADLLKMHAYKDAIRRTGGAYVLYPGDNSLQQKGFHEIIPGLGAFPVRPSKYDSGIGELKSFILEIIEHFVNRASQREKVAFRTYEVYHNEPTNILKESLPEPYGSKRDLIPDDTYVLVGYYNSKEQYEWIKRTKLYNFRMGSGNGSLILDKETVSSKYLLLHTLSDLKSGDLWRIISKGPKVFSKEDLIRKGYSTPSQDNYLVIQLEKVTDPEFENITWNFKNLVNYSFGRASSFPFTTNLTELMKNINK